MTADRDLVQAVIQVANNLGDVVHELRRIRDSSEDTSEALKNLEKVFTSEESPLDAIAYAVENRPIVIDRGPMGAFDEETGAPMGSHDVEIHHPNNLINDLADAQDVERPDLDLGNGMKAVKRTDGSE